MGKEQSILAVFKHSLVPRTYYSMKGLTKIINGEKKIRPVTYHFMCLSSRQTEYFKKDRTEKVDKILTEAETTLKIASSDGEVGDYYTYTDHL